MLLFQAKAFICPSIHAHHDISLLSPTPHPCLGKATNDHQNHTEKILLPFETEQQPGTITELLHADRTAPRNANPSVPSKEPRPHNIIPQQGDRSFPRSTTVHTLPSKTRHHRHETATSMTLCNMIPQQWWSQGVCERRASIDGHERAVRVRGACVARSKSLP
jgi:hypothetical protein